MIYAARISSSQTESFNYLLHDFLRGASKLKAKYPICDFFQVNEVLHCASLVITPNLSEDNLGRKTFAQPSDEIKNGTITFVELEGKTYGITCWHVIESYRKAEEKHGQHSHTMRTMVNGFYVIIDRFIRPTPEYGQPPLDIAIRELNPALLRELGKKPLSIASLPDIPKDIQHAIAVGFPTDLKHKKHENKAFHQISMPHVVLLAELNGSIPTQRFTLFSELEEKPDILDYSGASGGPIFWSTETEYGILGIIYESVAGSELIGEKAIHVSGELAKKETLKDWIKQYHQKSTHPKCQPTGKIQHD